VRAASGRVGRHLLYDSNHWKQFVHARLAVPAGDRGCLSLYGTRPEEHRLLGNHLTAEAPRQVSSGGRTVDEWERRPGGGDNHLLDVLAMTAAAASHQGCVLAEAGAQPAPKRERRRVSYAQMQAEAMARQGLR
jgi:hypothetical protein